MSRRVSPLTVSLVLAALAAAALAAQDATIFRDTQAQDLFRNSRLAVTGTPGAITRLRSLSLKGKSHLATADGSTLDASVEIKILLPDHFLRTDSTPTGERLEGYAGSKLLNVMRGGGRTSAPPDEARPQILKSERAELARLMLGIATYVSTEQPMSFFSRGTPVAMPGQPGPLGLDVIDDRGQALLRFFVDADTKFPARLVFWGFARDVLTMTFTDRRTAGGYQLPHRIATTTSAGQTADELIFDEILVNPPLTKAEFTR